MDRRAQITSTPLHIPSILVVLDPAWPSLFGRCLTAASRCGVMAHRCDVTSAPTLAAERRPLVIVVSNAVHAADPAELDALARDVRAILLRVDEEVTERELEAMLAGAFRERGRPEEGGRYTFIGSTAEEVPMARPSQPPPARLSQPPSSRGAPPSVRGAPPSVRGAPPSVRGAPPSVRGAPPASTQLSPRGSYRMTPPPMSSPPLSPRGSYRMTPPPTTPPPSVRAAYRDAPGGMTLPPPSTRAPYRATPAPQSVRPQPPSMPPGGLPPPPPRVSPTLTPAPFVAPPSSPRSGVRERSGEELDAVFDEQGLPLDDLQHRPGEAGTPR